MPLPSQQRLIRPGRGANWAGASRRIYVTAEKGYLGDRPDPGLDPKSSGRMEAPAHHNATKATGITGRPQTNAHLFPQGSGDGNLAANRKTSKQGTAKQAYAIDFGYCACRSLIHRSVYLDWGRYRAIHVWRDRKRPGDRHDPPSGARLAAHRGPQSAHGGCSLTPKGGARHPMVGVGGGSLWYPVGVQWHRQCLASDCHDPPTNTAQEDANVVCLDPDGPQPRAVHAQRKIKWWKEPAKGPSEATQEHPKLGVHEGRRRGSPMEHTH